MTDHKFMVGDVVNHTTLGKCRIYFYAESNVPCVYSILTGNSYSVSKSDITLHRKGARSILRDRLQDANSRAIDLVLHQLPGTDDDVRQLLNQFGVPCE